MQEREMIEQIRRRDSKGAEALLQHYGPLMKYIIRPILPNVQDQEDCLSEVMMRVWEKIELFDAEHGSWTAWLTAVTRNTALNRSRQRTHAGNALEILAEIPSAEPTPEEVILQRERQNELSEVLKKLDSRERMLFYRKYYYLQSTAQIASELGTTERAVEGKLYRLKKKLRRQLGGDERA